jgi:hypothetical protein
VAKLNRGRVSGPAQAALSGSPNEAPGSAGGNLTNSDPESRQGASHLKCNELLEGGIAGERLQASETVASSRMPTKMPRFWIEPKPADWSMRSLFVLAGCPPECERDAAGRLVHSRAH